MDGSSATNTPRIPDRHELLPGIDGRTTAARVFRDTIEAMVEHLGGVTDVTEPQLLMIRRVAAIEVQLLSLEAAFARSLAEQDEVGFKRMQAYLGMVGRQQRLLEALGLARKPRDITPDLKSYLAQRGQQAAA